MIVPVALLLNACTISDAPFVGMCQKITEQLVGDSNIDWQNEEKTAGSDMRVDLAFSSGGQDQSVTCLYKSKSDKEDSYNTMNENERYKKSPYHVVLNGQKVSDALTLKAALAATRDLTIESTGIAKEMAEEFSSDAASAIAGATETAREAVLKAAVKVQEKLQK